MNKRDKGAYGHVLKYTGIFGGVQGISIIVSLVRNKLIALLLGPSGMGLASLFNTTVSFIFQGTNLGVAFSAVRNISELYDRGEERALAHEVNVVRSWSLLTALLGMLICIVIGPLMSHLTFDWGNHSFHFVLLAPAVGMMAITGGETAILKGCRQLKSLVWVQVGAVMASLLISVPVYYFFGESGIVPVIVLMAFVTMLLTVRRSVLLFPLRLTTSKQVYGEGMGMVRLGIAYTLAAIVGSTSEIIIRAFLNVAGSLDVLGLYNAGYMLTVTYAGMVFSAMETDYFPRLSGIHHDTAATNATVNRQMEVSLLLLSPMLVVLIIMLPILIPLLFSSQFLPVVGMAQVAALAMYFKVMTLPVAYITLARGQSMAYLMLESSYYIVFFLLIILGYRQWGLYGTGIAITIAHLFDFLLINAFAYIKYGYRCTATVFRYAGVQVLIGVSAFALTVVSTGLAYWSFGVLLILMSIAFSLLVLRRKTHLWQALTHRFRRKR